VKLHAIFNKLPRPLVFATIPGAGIAVSDIGPVGELCARRQKENQRGWLAFGCKFDDTFCHPFELFMVWQTIQIVTTRDLIRGSRFFKLLGQPPLQQRGVVLVWWPSRIKAGSRKLFKRCQTICRWWVLTSKYAERCPPHDVFVFGSLTNKGQTADSATIMYGILVAGRRSIKGEEISFACAKWPG